MKLNGIISLKVAFLILFAQIFLACRSEFDCLNRTGKIITVRKPIKPFQTIELFDNINLELHPTTDTFATVEAGENLIDKIILENTNETLTISNRNSCNWIRSPDKAITVRVGVNQVTLFVVHRGSGKVYSNTNIEVAYLVINAINGSGETDIMTNNLALTFYSNTQAPMQASGKTKDFFVQTEGIGRISAEKLQADTVRITHEGANEVRVFPVIKLEADIRKNGNVVYYNQPIQIIETISGSGKLIKR